MSRIHLLPSHQTLEPKPRRRRTLRSTSRAIQQSHIAKPKTQKPKTNNKFRSLRRACPRFPLYCRRIPIPLRERGKRADYGEDKREKEKPFSFSFSSFFFFLFCFFFFRVFQWRGKGKINVGELVWKGKERTQSFSYTLFLSIFYLSGNGNGMDGAARVPAGR